MSFQNFSGYIYAYSYKQSQVMCKMFGEQGPKAVSLLKCLQNINLRIVHKASYFEGTAMKCLSLQHDTSNKEFQLIRERHGGLLDVRILSIPSGNYFSVCESLWGCRLTIPPPQPTGNLQRNFHAGEHKVKFPVNDISVELPRQWSTLVLLILTLHVLTI